MEKRVYELNHHNRYGKKAVAWYAQLPGFRDLPLDCFEIQEFVIDRDMVCTEGFSFPPHHVNAMSEDEAWPD